MSRDADLGAMHPGFADVALGSQAAFRAGLEALSHPGRIVEVASDHEPPAGLDVAASALLLSLLDPDTALWVAPGLEECASYLRFHTGCPVAGKPADADYVLADTFTALPPLGELRLGTDDYPDRSSTVVVHAQQLYPHGRWILTGPGIARRVHLGVPDAPASFHEQWAANHGAFPRGVDLFVTSGNKLAALARTTRIETGAV